MVILPQVRTSAGKKLFGPVETYPIVTERRGVTSVLSAYMYRIPLLQDRKWDIPVHPT